MLYKILFVIFILYYTPATGQQQSIGLLVCEDDIMDIECPKGSSIEILNALYGKRDTRFCNTPDNNVTDCAAENALDLIKSKCDYKQVCKIQASNNVFGNPCAGSRKYLQVFYQCKPGKIITNIVCEQEKINIQCEPGWLIKITHAFYGRTDQLLCNKPNVNIVTNKCDIGNATEKVGSRCDNLEQCTLEANNSVFGDPCVNTYKYLLVDHQCIRPGRQEEYHRLACEGETLEAECPKGSTIDIISALYGKQDSRICQEPGSNVNNCAAGNTINIAKFRCNHRQKCSILASNHIFSDPCVGTKKYLEVNYECVTGNIETKVACEGEDLTIKCPDEHVIRTTNALYGRKNPLICSNPHRLIKTNNCESGSSLNLVQSKCDGLQECTVQAINGNFGDPCYKTYKYLEVDYQCLPRTLRIFTEIGPSEDDHLLHIDAIDGV